MLRVVDCPQKHTCSSQMFNLSSDIIGTAKNLRFHNYLISEMIKVTLAALPQTFMSTVC